MLIDNRPTDSQGRKITPAPFDRYSTATNDHTRWYYQLWTLPRFGVRSRQRTLITERNPRDDIGHPYEMLRSACFSAKDQHKKGNVIPVGAYGSSLTEGWDKLISDTESSTPGPGGKTGVEYKALPKADQAAFLFGLVCSIGDSSNKNDTIYDPPLGVDATDPLPIVMLSGATFSKLMLLMSAFRPDVVRPAADDLSALMIPRLTSSKYIHVFDMKAGCAARNAAEAERLGTTSGQPGGSWGMSRRSSAQVSQTPVGATTFGGGYDVHVSDTRDGTSGGQRIPTADVDSLAANRLMHPADVFKISSYDEIARALCESGLPPGLLYYAFQNRSEWLPPSIRDGFSAKVSAQVKPTSAVTSTWPAQVTYAQENPTTVAPKTVIAEQPVYGTNPWPTSTGAGASWGSPATQPSTPPQHEGFDDLPSDQEGSVSADLRNQVEAALAEAARSNPALQRSMSSGGVGRV